MSSPKSADFRLELCYRLVAWGAGVWMLMVGLWELTAPFGAGHVAVLPARGIIADNMVGWGIWYPVRDYVLGLPRPSQAYTHHPFGSYYVFAALRWLFGRHEAVIRLFPVLVSAAMPLLLGALARRLWGTVAGALAAFGWAVLPITLAFAQFPSFELFSCFTWVLISLFAVRFVETFSHRDGLLLGLACLLAAHSDWIGSLYAGLVLLWGFCAVAFWPKLHLKSEQYRLVLRYGVLAGLMVGVSTLAYVLWFQKVGRSQDWLDSATFRARDNSLPLLSVLSHRRYWIEAMFTKPGIALGLLGALAMVLRTVMGRRWVDTLPLVMLLVSSFHYIYFKNGADTHIYWPLPFAVQFSLSLGLLGASCGRFLVMLLSRLKRPHANTEGTLVALGLMGGAAAVLLPDALRTLDYARNTGCRLNDDGYLNLQDLDKTAALRFFRDRIPEQKVVALHPSLMPNWSQPYALRRPTVGPGYSVSGVSFNSAPYMIFDLRQAPDSQLSAVAGEGGMRVVGPYGMVDRERGEGPLSAWKFEPHAPSVLQWLFYQAHDPIVRIIPDPFSTWELRHHLNQTPNPEPPRARSLEEFRVAYNVAVSRGDEAGMKSGRAELERQLDRHSVVAFTEGVELLGHVLSRGRPTTLALYFYAQKPLAVGLRFDVTSRVRSAPRGSFVVADDKLKHLSTGFPIPPSRWKSQMIYSLVLELRPRPGLEAFYGSWVGSALSPRLPGGKASVPLFELE